MWKFLSLALVLIVTIKPTPVKAVPYASENLVAPFFMPDPNSELGETPEIYPNPVTGQQVTVMTSRSILFVQILNITGKIVLQQKYPPLTPKVDIDLSPLEKGIYLIRIGLPDNNLYTEKIMIK
jgi:hypothetical protein